LNDITKTLKEVFHMNCYAAEFYTHFADRFTEWAGYVDDIQAAFIIGSRARMDHPADDWSDMDILLFTTNPSYYLEHSEWLEGLGKVLCSFSTYTAGGDPERLSLFEGGYQVDFVVANMEELNHLAQTNTVHGNFYRGVRVLVDKNSICSHIMPRNFHAPAAPPVTQEAFSHVCHMFWFVALYVAKQILRNEMWVAKARDSDLKGLLLRMIEWYEKAANGSDYDTWHAGRFLQEWASPDVYAGVSASFGGFHQSESWDALMESTALFKRLSHDVAAGFDFTIPETEKFVELWFVSNKDQIAGAL